MGISKFRSQLPPHILEDVITVKAGQAKNIYFDMNNIFWKILRTLKEKDKFHKYVQSRVFESIRKYRPSNIVYFALDGASPLAKIPLQRGFRCDVNVYSDLHLRT
jgi:5'-3' exonuclease